MVLRERAPVEYNICDKKDKLKALDEIVKTYPNISVDKESLYLQTRNQYSDYSTYNIKKFSNKLYNDGIYYKLFAQQIPDADNKVKLLKYSLNYFQDANITVSDPLYKHEIQNINKILSQSEKECLW